MALIRSMTGLVAATMALAATSIAHAAAPPATLTIGTLYASSGPFAVSSEGQYHGLQFWAAQVNKTGGVFVKAFDRKIPVKIIAYDDQSSTSTATTLYNQLITQDHVDLLVADFGSVLTSVAIPLAEEHHMLLIDPTGSGANFFTQKTDYLADVSIPASTVWPVPLGHFINDQKQIKRVAVLYDSNDFDASQANTLKSVLAKAGTKPVYFHAVPTSETNYTVLIHAIAARRPDALIEFGYPDNDIAFLKALKSSGLHFNMVFTIFPGQLLTLLTKNVGARSLAYTYTYPAPPLVSYKTVSYGLNTADFVDTFKSAEHRSPNFLDAAGYNTGIVMQDMLGTAPKFTQLDFHAALMDMSGHTKTLLGPFKLNAEGAQLGQPFPVAQLVPSGATNKLVVVYPKEKATGKPVYPAPKS